MSDKEHQKEFQPGEKVNVQLSTCSLPSGAVVSNAEEGRLSGIALRAE